MSTALLDADEGLFLRLEGHSNLYDIPATAPFGGTATDTTKSISEELSSRYLLCGAL